MDLHKDYDIHYRGRQNCCFARPESVSSLDTQVPKVQLILQYSFVEIGDWSYTVVKVTKFMTFG